MIRLLSTISIVALLAGTATAGDAPRGTTIYKAPAASIFDWTGFYIGAHGGYSWGQTDGSIGPFCGGPGCGPFSYSADTTGWLVGGQIGAQRQMGNLVLGVNLDLSYLDSKGSSGVSGLPAGFPATAATQNMHYLGTAEVKVGYLFANYERWLPFVTGGAACGRSKLSISSAAFAASSSKVDKCGYVVGAGLEYLLAQNVVVGARYQYVDLGNANPSFPIAGAPGVGITAPMDQQYHIVKAMVGLKY